MHNLEFEPKLEIEPKKKESTKPRMIYSDDEEMIRSIDIGKSITDAYTKTVNITTTKEKVKAKAKSFAVTLENNQMHNIRETFYKTIIEKPNAKELLITKMSYIIEGLESSGTLKRYKPTELNPISVFKNEINVANITQSVATIGRHNGLNTIFENTHGVSRIHAILVFMKDLNEKIIMIVIDAWSKTGTYLLTESNTVSECSDADDRKILITHTKSSVVRFGDEKYRFRTTDRSCIVCMERIRNVRYDCGHGVVCSECDKGLNLCPLCQKPINRNDEEQSLCIESFQK